MRGRRTKMTKRSKKPLKKAKKLEATKPLLRGFAPTTGHRA
jgi:hypothetical protein